MLSKVLHSCDFFIAKRLNLVVDSKCLLEPNKQQQRFYWLIGNRNYVLVINE